jgi:hypothetical protein
VTASRSFKELYRLSASRIQRLAIANVKLKTRYAPDPNTKVVMPSRPALTKTNTSA